MSPLLEVRDLTVRFGHVAAVESVGFTVAPGECLALVGESGAGKSLALAALLGLTPQAAAVSGSVLLEGAEIVGARAARLRAIRGGRAGMVFQDPMQSLNPFLTIGLQMREGIMRHRHVSRRQADAAAEEMLTRVGIDRPAARLRQHPGALSGGMRQRVAIGIALLCRPPLLLADEPTTALDATVQAQVLDLLQDLRRAMRLAVVIVTHNLGVVARIADRVAVMYAGRIVEMGPAATVLTRPTHPYTAGLLSAVPLLRGPRRLPTAIPGEPPGPGARAGGCAFAPRCPARFDACGVSEPALLPRAASQAACHLGVG